VNPALVRRQLALGGVALLAALGALSHGRAPAVVGGGAASASSVAPDVRWYEALAGAYGQGLYGRTTACGVTLTRETRGIAHPVLPCGAKILVLYGARTEETRDVDRGPYAAGHAFDLTQALADDLGVRGIQPVRWRFADR
jgi:rare lipoprotein A (peptidoglycan hydrolase)